MWKEGVGALSVAVVAVFVVYSVFSQGVPQVDGPATPDSGVQANSTYSTDSSSPTTSTDYSAPATSTTNETTTTAVEFGPAWISQFFSILNVDRGRSATLTPCPHLDSFAALRFQTLNTGNNWEIIHYGYSADLQNTYGGTVGSYAEGYFYPLTPYRSPGGFADFVRTTAPGHWSDLVNPVYSFYGAYTGTGPILLFPHNCGPSEFSAGVNQTQVPSGCTYQKITGTWLIVELSDSCI